MVGVVARGAQRADEDLRLRALGLVDDHEAPAARPGRIVEGVERRRGAARERGREALGDLRGLLRAHVAGEAEGRGLAQVVPAVVGLERLWRDRGEGARAPLGRAAERVSLEHRGAEGDLREVAVAVARLDELREHLLAQSLDLVGCERGAPEDLGEQVHEPA